MDNSFIIQNHDRPVDMYGNDARDGHKWAKTVDTAVGYRSAHQSMLYPDDESIDLHQGSFPSPGLPRAVLHDV